MSDNFELAVKSTLDYLLTSAQTAMLADNAELLASELDDLVAADKVFSSPAPALFWQLRTLTPTLANTLYSVQFLVGVKTVDDKANYLLMDLLSKLSERIEAGANIPVCDYSIDSPPFPELGMLFVVRKDMQAGQFDRQSGLRFVLVEGRLSRWP